MNKRFLLAIFFLLTGYFTFAQYTVTSKYFVYLQTEPAQPFYIKINNQRIAANTSGYLILPQLKDGDYKLTVGFENNKHPEMMFNFRIDSKDKGYLIKDFGAEGWSLFDLQTMAVQKPLSAEEMALANKPIPKPQPAVQPAPKPAVTPAPAPEVAPTPQPAPAREEVVPAENVSDFTKVLARAANDPSILEQPKPIEKPVVKETPVEAAPVVEAQPNPAPEEIKKPVAKKSELVKISQADTEGGTRVVYEDRTGNAAERIEILIPATSPAPAAVESPASQTPEPVATAPKEQEEKFEVVEKPAVQKAPEVAPPVTLKPGGNCKEVATEDDFLKLRRDMASKDNDDKMIEEAQKAFKKKCYSTDQVKYISSMFLSNAGKYNFFVSAFAHVADPENFSSLKVEIKDAYYQGKFNEFVK